MWVDNSSVEHTSTLDVKDGVDGTDGIDAVQISSIVATSDNKIKVVMADGTAYETATIPTVKGEDGISPTARTERVSDGANVIVTDKDGTTTSKLNDGISPVTSVQRNSTDTGVILTVVDASGTHSATINDGSVTATLDYTTGVTGKPKINNVEISGNKSLTEYGINIPTKNSQLINDSGFITESDIPSVDGALSQVSENAVQKITIQDIQPSSVSKIDSIPDNVTSLEIKNMVTRGTCTLDSAVTSGGNITWVKSGKVVTLRVNLGASGTIPQNATIATGAPKALTATTGIAVTSTGAAKMLQVDTSGVVTHTNGGGILTSTQLYGDITYITSE